MNTEGRIRSLTPIIAHRLFTRSLKAQTCFVLSDWLSHNPAGLKFTMELKTNLDLIPYTLFPPLYMVLGIDPRDSSDWAGPNQLGPSPKHMSKSQ